MKFVVDCMLGKLAKWLKILGFEAHFFSAIKDAQLLSFTQKKGGVLLTRDTRLIEESRGLQTLFIASEKWREQVVQVLDAFDLWEEVRPYSRCIECNLELKNLPKKRAKNLVTSFVYANADSFALCPRCERVFWQGSHFKDMEFKVRELFQKGQKNKNKGAKSV